MEGVRCYAMNPVLPCPLFLSLTVDNGDIVDCTIDAMRQVSKNISSLVTFLI